jgi:sigma-B regulation protein RsbU (phosphoserine phosphatase)
LEKKHLRDLQKLYLKSLQREFEIAREIQNGFLPSEIPVVEGWNIATYFKAAKEVAGDFYDAFLLDDHVLVYLIGDVCGKGVGAALFMTLFRSLIRAITIAEGLTLTGRNLSASERLGKVISFTNNYIAETHGDSNMFATIFIGALDIQTGKFNYINAGNEPPIILKQDGSILHLPATGPVVGIIPDTDFGVKEISLDAGDSLIAYTDGIPDALNSEKIAYGNQQLVEELKSNHKSSAEMVESIKQSLDGFIGDEDQFDDITLLVLKRD